MSEKDIAGAELYSIEGLDVVNFVIVGAIETLDGPRSEWFIATFNGEAVINGEHIQATPRPRPQTNAPIPQYVSMPRLEADA